MLCHAIRANIASFLLSVWRARDEAARGCCSTRTLKEPADRGQPATLLRELRKVHLHLLLMGGAYMDQPIVLAQGVPSKGSHAPTPEDGPDP